MKAERQVKVKVVYEEGYEKRFTDSCLAVLRRSMEARALEARRPGATKASPAGASRQEAS